ncbi:HAD domain-containing protein [Variovorax rhizosphaerae]|uniref:HAD domain-containing protein n=1 Tax=Variovorax rhizosphaerae TaxID=1836200 RepID=A0ABU8WV88_9BURK
MILFLDFDGVLHPVHDGEFAGPPVFCHLPRLERLLREFPRVDVVITSKWREHLSLEILREFFSEDIRPRVVGMTPLTQPNSLGYMQARREEAVIAWLQEHGMHEGHWVALDADDWQFPNHRDRLVACIPQVGFDDQTEASLRAHFERWRKS